MQSCAPVQHDWASTSQAISMFSLFPVPSNQTGSPVVAVQGVLRRRYSGGDLGRLLLHVFHLLHHLLLHLFCRRIGSMRADHPCVAVWIHNRSAPIAPEHIRHGPLPSAPRPIAFETTLSTFST